MGGLVRLGSGERRGKAQSPGSPPQLGLMEDREPKGSWRRCSQKGRRKTRESRVPDATSPIFCLNHYLCLLQVHLCGRRQS